MQWFFGGRADSSVAVNRILLLLETHKVNPIKFLLDSDVLEDDERSKLLVDLNKDVSNYLNSFQELKELETKIGGIMNKEAQDKKEQLQKNLIEELETKLKTEKLQAEIDAFERYKNKKAMLRRLANRTHEICRDSKGALGSNLIMSLLDIGVLSQTQKDDLMEFINDKILDFFSECSEDQVMSTINSLMYYKCIKDKQRANEADMVILKQRGGVKSRATILQRLFEAPRGRKAVIKVAPIAIDRHFAEKMGQIHQNKSEPIIKSIVEPKVDSKVEQRDSGVKSPATKLQERLTKQINQHYGKKMGQIESKVDSKVESELVSVVEARVDPKVEVDSETVYCKGSKLKGRRIGIWEWKYVNDKVQGIADYTNNRWTYYGQNNLLCIGAINSTDSVFTFGDQIFYDEAMKWFMEEVKV